jgi:hypothetical protein
VKKRTLIKLKRVSQKIKEKELLKKTERNKKI